MERLTKMIGDMVELPLMPMNISNKEELDYYHKIRRFYELAIIKLAEYENKEDQGNLVEVVRCKDCKHFANDEIGWCDLHSHLYQPELEDWFMFDQNDYCSYGERKGEK